MNNDRNRLYDFILEFYPTEQSVRELCFRMFVNYDDLSGRARKDKIRELIEHVEHTGRINDLHEQAARQHMSAYRAAFQITFPTPVAPAIAERNPRQVFISHAHQDSDKAHQLADDLERAGHPVWIAPESIRSGEDWVEAIGRGLDESSYFAVILTPAGVASRWVKREANLAARMAVDEELTFIPLWYEPCRVPTLWDYQRVPFDRGYTAGLAALLECLGSEPVDTSHRKVFPPMPDRRIHEKTGIELIRIPAGPFLYGSADSDEWARSNEKPQKTIDLPEYWIGRAPVTNLEFKLFIDANPTYPVPFSVSVQGKPYSWDRDKRMYPPNKADHPVVLVSWEDAKAFCDWAGLALPTEEQWEKAARGTDGRIWPWGNDSPTDKYCNFGQLRGGTTPVGQYALMGNSPYGCVDMAGNVWEWTASWYLKERAPVLRGSSWRSVNNVNTRAGFRSYNDPLTQVNHGGFRVVELLSDPGS